MKRHLLLIVIALLMGAACPPLRAQDAAAFDISGRGDHLWLVRLGEAGFEVFTRKSAGNWKTVGGGYSGAILLSLAGDERLNVFFAGRQLASLDIEGRLTPAALLPADPLAASYLPAGEDGKELSLLMLGHVDNGEAATQPTTTEPSLSPKELRMTVFRLKGDMWTPLAVTPTVRIRPQPDEGAGWSMAATADRIHLAHDQGGDHADGVLLIYDLAANAWLPTADLPDLDTVVHVVAGKLVAIGRPDSRDEQVRQQLHLRTWDPAAGWSQPQVIRRNSEPMHWPAVPRVAAAGERLIFLWRSDGDILLATCGLDGALLPSETVSQSIAAIPDTNLVTEVRQNFILGLLIVLVVIAIVLRPRDRSKLFVLPPVLIPGSLPKRALAAMLDFAPFLLVAVLYVVLTHTEGRRQAAMADPQAVTLGMTIASLAMISAYVAYGAIYE